MASSSKLRHAPSVSNTSAPEALPTDALFKVRLCLPAKDLCSLRAVCQSWRALTYDPHFAVEHESRHAEPLFALTFRDGDVRGITIVSLSGQILKRIRFASDRIELLLTHLVRLFVFRWCKPSLSAWVLNLGVLGFDRDSPNFVEFRPFRSGPKQILRVKSRNLTEFCPKLDQNFPRFTHFGWDRIFSQNESQNLDLGTAAPHTLPGLHSYEFVGTCIQQRFDFGPYVTHDCKTVTFAFGQVASTGDYKVLRISHPHPDSSQPQLCDIITLDGSSQGRWRRKQNPPSDLMTEPMECLAVNGVVYFFFDFGLMEPTSIAPFDLDTEKWMPTLRGPEPLRSVEFGAIFLRAVSLANLNGSLVIVDTDFGVSNFDLWFLVDHKRGLWVKKYILSVEQTCDSAPPLLILDDGRIVVFNMIKGLLQCYDPTTDILADVLDIGAIGLAESQSIGVYTGSLLI